jgi:uracil-DNA glycosylase
MTEIEQDSMERVASEVRVCIKCDLCKTRTKAVPGSGSYQAEVLFIGEAPGMHEDRQGKPFVGPSGQFLDELLVIAKLTRDSCFITNVVKCWLTENRDPQPNEIAACADYLERQIALLNPRLIVTLGRYSMAKFFPSESISRIHGKLRTVKGRYVLPMYHPAAALHQATLRNTVIEDFKQIPLALDLARKSPLEPPKPEDEPPTQLSLF